MTSVILSFHWASVDTNENYACAEFRETVIPAGSKREYGLVSIIIKWWTDVQQPQNLHNVSRQICTDFGLQYLDDANISKT
jgi:hypothetical protein